MKNGIYILLINLVLFCSCKNRIGYKEYFNFYNTFQEASYQEVIIDGFIYQLQFRPSEFQALNELRSSGTFDKSKVKKLANDFNNGALFCLKISSTKHEDVLKKNLEEDAEYFSRIEELSTSFKDHIYGLNPSDTIKCQFHHFERNYGIQPFIKLLFVLGSSKGLQPTEVIFSDKIFNKNQDVIFKNLPSYYAELPQLKL